MLRGGGRELGTGKSVGAVESLRRRVSRKHAVETPWPLLPVADGETMSARVSVGASPRVLAKGTGVMDCLVVASPAGLSTGGRQRAKRRHWTRGILGVAMAVGWNCPPVGAPHVRVDSTLLRLRLGSVHFILRLILRRALEVVISPAGVSQQEQEAD